MSIRYVWGRYNVSQTVKETISESTKRYVVEWRSIGLAAQQYTIDKENGVYVPDMNSGTREIDNETSVSTNNMNNIFVTPEGDTSGQIDYTTRITDPNPHSRHEFHFTDYSKGWYLRLWDYDNSRELYYDVYKLTKLQTQGSKIDDISTPTSGQYPSNGVSGSYWYVYQGQDSIDPVSIEAPVTNWLYTGQQVVVTASPSVSKIYGGTVSYQYQVQINGGSWTNIGNKTTATSVNYTIPEGTVSIAFRVQASDDLGFTSADWIQSETYTVSEYEPGIKHRVHRKNESGEYDITHFETDTSCVLMSDGTSLEDQLVNIISEIERRGG